MRPENAKTRQRIKCPHCKRIINSLKITNIVPTHDYPVPCRAVCPGSGSKLK